MNDKVIELLLVEDSAGDARLIQEMLNEPRGRSRFDALFNVTHVPDLAACMQHLEVATVNAMLLDLDLPDSRGLDTFNRVFDAAPDLAIVMLSGLSDQAVAVRAVQLGAQDYLVKGEVDPELLARSLVYAMERKQSEKALKDSQERFQSLFENLAIGIYRLSAAGDLVMANPALVDLLGYSSFLEVAGKNIEDLGLQLEYSRSIFNQLIERHGPVIRLESVWEGPGGQLLHIRETGKAVLGAGGEVRYFEGTIEDITERVQAQESMRLAARVFDSTSEGILVTDMQGQIIQVNTAFSQITGYSAAEAVGRNPRFLKSRRHSEDFYKKMWSSLMEHGVWRGEIWNRRKDGEIYAQWLTINAVNNDAGAQSYYIGIFMDISSRMQNEELLRYLATHDSLTSLPNRELFWDRLVQAIARAQRNDTMVAIVMLDLDGFKDINDSLGHAQGDLLLKTLAERLLQAVRKTDTVARLGGDEFTVILEDIAAIGDGETAVQKILAVNRKAYSLEEGQVALSLSAGISFFPRDGDTPDSLLKKADEAMYAAKTARNGSFQTYDSSG